MTSLIGRCPSCGNDAFTGEPDIALVALAQEAMIATVEAAGFLPERIEDMTAYMAKWHELIRSHDPRLRNLSDQEIGVIIRNFGEPLPTSIKQHVE